MDSEPSASCASVIATSSLEISLEVMSTPAATHAKTALPGRVDVSVASDVLGDMSGVVSDILANAGGVAVSYFEWVQANQAF